MVSDKILIFNLFVGCFYRKGPTLSKIEKVPRDIRGEKSSKDMTSSRNLVSTIGAQTSPKMGNETRYLEELALPAGMPHPSQMLHENL